MDIEHITNREAKEALAKLITQKVQDNQTIGFGWGSTAYLAAIEIGKKVQSEKLNIIGIPTTKEMEELCKGYGIKIGNLLENELDWAFDGADEVDEKNNMIKGMGRAMFKEKLNIVSSPLTYILVDNTKLVKELGKAHPVPVEVFPTAVKYVSNELTKLGATETIYRGMTENNNAILDAKFDEIGMDLEKKIKSIPGVIESGLFLGYNVVTITN